jgi:hypothetical protein
MKRIALLILVMVVCGHNGIAAAGGVKTDSVQARLAFEYLNKVRTNPDAYVGEFVFLKWEKITRRALVWNDTLARAAERKVNDMATKNYFAHVDPQGFGMNHYINESGYVLLPDFLKDPANNFFESLYFWGTSDSTDPALVNTGEPAIKSLIKDDGVPDFGHRKHLLGIDDWNASLYDVGIGVATINGSGEGDDAATKVYVCVLIAKHGW